jgi:uncharacterized transporter YbjL
MSPQEFIIWLKGVCDGNEMSTLSDKQYKMMIKRLNNVMIEVEVDESETEDEPDFNRWSCTATADSSIERFIVEYTK